MARQQRSTGFQRQFGLFPGGDDADVEPRLVARPAQEFGAIGGTAASLGGDRADLAHRAAGQPGSAGLQRGDRPVHCPGVQLAGVVQAFAQAHDAGEAVEYPETIAAGGANEHAAVVGAQIEGRECGAGKPACLILPLRDKIEVRRILGLRHLPIVVCPMPPRQGPNATRFNAFHRIHLAPNQATARGVRTSGPDGGPGDPSEFSGKTVALSKPASRRRR